MSSPFLAQENNGISMGQATRTTKLALNFGSRTSGGMNSAKRVYLDTTVTILNRARAFYVDFFLAHSEKFAERVTYFSDKHQDYRERSISADELLTWAEFCTVPTKNHPCPLEGWNFHISSPGCPTVYRRSVIKDAIGKVRAYLSNLKNWEEAGGKKKGKPGLPQAKNHPLKEEGWEAQSPTLVVRPKQAALHIPQVKEVRAKKVKERKSDPDLVTVGIDLNIKNLAVITVRHHGLILKTVFCKDHGLDQHR